jgi:hypothetical protein
MANDKNAAGGLPGEGHPNRDARVHTERKQDQR